MASAFQKFKQLETQIEQQAPASVEKPSRKPKLQTYNHIVSKFETLDGDERKKIVQERLKQRQLEKEAKLEEERRRKQEEEERIRRQIEEEERLRKLQEEEEERRRLEEELRKAEEEEEQRREAVKRQHEGKFAGLKPAAAMFERALEAKRSMQKSIKGERVVTLRKGTISELRSKIFDSQPQEEPIVKRSKPVPKRVILDKKEDEKIQEMPKLKPSPKPKVIEEKKDVQKDVAKKDMKIEEKEVSIPKVENDSEEKGSKRQSFISDFAALEKTYKILGMTTQKDKKIEEEVTNIPKKRHNSEGKVKNKDKAKRKSAVVNNDFIKQEPTNTEEVKVPVINALDKGRASDKKNFFQTLINEKKGLVKKEPELIGPQLRKKKSLTSSFADTEDDSRRQSMIKDDIKVDKKKFNTFLDKFESKDQRAEAKQKMIKITQQQKDFEKKKQVEQELMIKHEKEKQEQELRRIEKEQLELQLALEEEARLLQLQEEEEERLRLEELQRMEKESKQTRKIVKKKKKIKEDEMENKEMPKLNLGVVNYTDVKKKFEKRKGDVEDKEQNNLNKSLKINKLSINPFLENINNEEKMQKQEVKVNKLQKNAFMRELEKMSTAPEPAKPEPKLKKISSEAHIKFASKKEKGIPQTEDHETSVDKKSLVKVSKSIEAQAPKKKNSRESKTGSTISLQKIFIDGPKEFFRSSKEKLYKLSKENLFEEKPNEENIIDHKLSKSEMQNYLLSHVLFDGSDVKKKEKKEKQKKDEDEIDKYLDQEYKDKISQYCSLLEEDNKPKKKKKKKTKIEEVKKEEKAPTMKLVEIKSIQQQLFQQNNQSSEKPAKKEEVVVEKKVNKFKEMFDENDTGVKVPLRSKDNQEKRKPRVKSDIFLKIQVLEQAEKERIEREKANEERMKKLLQLEMERHDKQANDVDESENNTDENFKIDIMKCLEDEVQNLEQEMLALETEEKLIIEEENEESNTLTAEEECHEETQEIEEHLHQLQEIHHEIEERKKTAANRKKVLERFQHVLDEEKEEAKVGKSVGSIKDRLANFLDNNDRKNSKSLDESVFVGVSDVMSRFKSKVENPEDRKPNSLFSKEEIRRKPNALAMQFEQMKDEEELLSPKPQSSKDWNWKKKTAQELHEEVEGSKEQSEPNISKKSHSFQDTKFNELLADINAVKQRLNERDAKRQEKENDRRLQEMEEAIREVQEALKYDESSDDEQVVERPRLTRRPEKKKVEEPRKSVSVGNNKIGELKTQLLSMINDDYVEKNIQKEEIDVNVSNLKNRLINNEESFHKEETQEKRSAQSSSSLVSKLAEKLASTESKDYEDLPLTKAPKRILKLDNMFEEEEAPAKTLEELKEENQNKKWAWKEKDMTDIQNYITAYDDVAPNKLKSQHQKLIDLDEEQRVVESLTKDKDTAILVQLREEKEQEFEKFMNEIHSYLKEGTKDNEENEFKQGMQGYIDLIHESDKRSSPTVKLPQVQLNTVSKMKTSLFEEVEETHKKPSPKVQKLNKQKIEKELIEQSAAKLQKTENVVTSQNLSSVKKVFEKVKEEEPRPEPKRDPSKPSIVEKFKRMAIDEKQKRYQHQLQHKLKTVSELHDYIQNHENLGAEDLSLSIRKFKMVKESEKLSSHQQFMNSLSEFLNQGNKNDEEATFRSNIQAYLSILNNTNSIYNATPKLKKHPGSKIQTQSNMRKAILEKSTERKPKVEPTKKPAEPKVLSPEERKKEILAKYGFKDRSNIVIQQISDDSESSDSDEEVDVKKMTDKQLAERYGLPYIEVQEEEESSIQKSNSSVGYTSLLSKIRNIQNEKSTSVSTGREIFDGRRDSTKDSPQNSPHPSQRSNTVTMRMKKKLEEVPSVDRKSWAYENEEIISYGATSKIKQRFECDSPDGSRSSSPATIDPGSVMTNKMKKLFEEKKEERKSPIERPRGLLKSSTVSNIGSGLTINQSPMLRHKTVEKYWDQETKSGSPTHSPQVSRTGGALEKSKSLSKIKNAFEFGKGLNDETENVGDLQSRKSIQAELDLLRSPSSKDTASPMIQRKFSQPETDNKANLVAAFFSGNKASGSAKPSPQLSRANKVNESKAGVQKSSTMSDISAYLKFKIDDQKTPIEAPIKKENESPNFNQGLAKSSSFSKFKNAFEDGVGLMDTESFDSDKHRVNAELNALKSSNKIQSMFRINKSKNPTEMTHETLEEEKTEKQVPSSERQDRRTQAKTENQEEGELQGRKWVFDTIQKYFDVIVEEGEEDEEEDEEDQDEDEGQSGSESEYTSAEDELPEVSLPSINKSLPSRNIQNQSFREKLNRGSPSFNSLPVQRPRASTGKKIFKNNFNCLILFFQFHLFVCQKLKERLLQSLLKTLWRMLPNNLIN